MRILKPVKPKFARILSEEEATRYGPDVLAAAADANQIELDQT
jgi:hypothetical protein